MCKIDKLDVLSRGLHGPVSAVLKVTGLIVGSTDHETGLLSQLVVIGLPQGQSITCQEIDMLYRVLLNQFNQKIVVGSKQLSGSLDKHNTDTFDGRG